MLQWPHSKLFTIITWKGFVGLQMFWFTILIMRSTLPLLRWHHGFSFHLFINCLFTFSMLSMVASGHEPWDRGGLWAPLQQLHPAGVKAKGSFTQLLNLYTTSCKPLALVEKPWTHHSPAHQGPFFSFNSHGMILLVRGHLVTMIACLTLCHILGFFVLFLSNSVPVT